MWKHIANTAKVLGKKSQIRKTSFNLSMEGDSSLDTKLILKVTIYIFFMTSTRSRRRRRRGKKRRKSPQKPKKVFFFNTPQIALPPLKRQFLCFCTFTLAPRFSSRDVCVIVRFYYFSFL